MSLGADYLADYAYEIYMAQNESECVCGKCKWNRHVGKGFCCGNTRSKNYTHYTAYSDSCAEWSGKEYQ